ncbi:MAG TPA: hypothetical protein V6D14_12185 [Coleofasciculaceae cyanobacterium]
MKKKLEGQQLDKIFSRIPHRLSVTMLLVIAGLVRLGYWLRVGQPIYAGDSQGYILWAKLLAQGNTSGFEQFPLHQLYSLVLTPIYSLGIPEGEYIKYLHIFASTATVGLMYLAGRLLVSPGYGLLVGALTALYPKFIFWLPYVLTETGFLFCLSMFLAIFIAFLKRPNLWRFLAYLGMSILLFFSRPVSLPILLISTTILGALFLARHWGLRKMMIICASFWFSLVTTVCIAFATNTELQTRILKLPTFTQSLWLSTKLSSNSMEETLSVLKDEQQRVENLVKGLPPGTEWTYKATEATRFITRHPLAYLGMAARRFISFWYPWIFSDSWSLAHRIFDACVSLLLSMGTVALLFHRNSRTPEIISLTLMALSLAILTSFSQIDTDGRYRLPAELILLLISPISGVRLIERLLISSRRKPSPA